MQPSKPEGPAAQPDLGQDKPSNPRKEIPLVSVPSDREMIEAEMAELFEEDKVTHQHGSSEPEAD